MKKAAIYDRWLHVLGGGEKHTIFLAQAVAEKGYQVEILTHRPTNKEELKKKFGLNKLDFSIKYIPEAWDYQLTPYTKEYDLFVLSSFADIFKSEAKKSILSIFFPVTQKLSFKEFLTRVIIVPTFRNLFQFNLYQQHDSGLITVGRNKPEREITLNIFLSQLALSTVEQLKVTALNSKVDFETRVFHHKNIIQIKAKSDQPTKQWQLHYPISQYSKGITLKVKNNSFNQLAELFISKIPFIGERMKAGPRNFSLDEIKSYDKILANSQYTARWIKNYWSIDSEVIYPPVEIEKFKPSKKKKKQIISIGRFFVGGHNKKQLEMVRSFKKIFKKTPGWELHLVGSVNDGEVHRNYFNQIKTELDGYPIFIHENVEFNELKKLLEESTIYWHASGLGINENKYPVMIEHFGLTIVEAMAAGCVPIVIDKGGPGEVAKGKGITWLNLDQLEKETIELIQNHQEMLKLQKNLGSNLEKYNLKTFESKIKSIIKQI